MLTEKLALISFLPKDFARTFARIASEVNRLQQSPFALYVPRLIIACTTSDLEPSAAGLTGFEEGLDPAETSTLFSVIDRDEVFGLNLRSQRIQRNS